MAQASPETEIALSRMEIQGLRRDLERLTRLVDAVGDEARAARALADAANGRSWLMSTSTIRRAFGVWLHMLLAQFIFTAGIGLALVGIYFLGYVFGY